MKKTALEKQLRRELKKMRNRWGYDFQIIVIQGKKKRSKIIRLHDVGRKGIYTPNNVFWITINILKRMKDFWGFHKGKIRIKFVKLRYKK